MTGEDRLTYDTSKPDKRQTGADKQKSCHTESPGRGRYNGWGKVTFKPVIYFWFY